MHPPGHVGAVPQVCATDVRRPRRGVQGTHNLLAAARAAGAPHLVYVSIVGVDRVPVPYYRIKLEVEQLVEASCLPWTVLRATQFHDLVASALWVLTRPRQSCCFGGEVTALPVAAGDRSRQAGVPSG